MAHPTTTGWTGPIIRRAMIAVGIGWLALTALLLAGQAVGQAAFADRPLLAFVTNYDTDESVIYLADVRGRIALPWWHVPGIRSLAASPDGQWLASSVNRGIVLVDRQTGAQRYLSEVDSVNDTDDFRVEIPQWSPDSQWLAYVRIGWTRIVFAHNVYTEEQRRLPQEELFNDWPAWSPDGRQMSYTSRLDNSTTDMAIDLVDLATGQTRRLVDQATYGFPLAWSPDGHWLAYVAMPEQEYAIYRIEVATGLIQRLTHDAYANSRPAWSPDGEQLAFVSERNNQPDVYVMDMQTRQVRGFGNHLDRAGQPTWSPDGRWIAFVCSTGPTYRICVVDTHLDETYLLSPSGSSFITPVWLP